MNQKSSFREVPQFVSRALTADSRRRRLKKASRCRRGKGKG
jgi:hypothetical protein